MIFAGALILTLVFCTVYLTWVYLFDHDVTGRGEGSDMRALKTPKRCGSPVAPSAGGWLPRC